MNAEGSQDLRLLRDNVVYENWEGSHNVLRAQVLRDCSRLGVHGGFFDALAARLGDEHLGVRVGVVRRVMSGDVR